MMMSLGWFVFQLRTAPYQELQRNAAQSWASNDRIGKRPVYQYTGPGEETITLSGALLPEISGGQMHLNQLRSMAKTGKAWILISGDGSMLGTWFIEAVEETQSIFFKDGTPRKIEFTLNLKRCDEEETSMLGDLVLSLYETIV